MLTVAIPSSSLINENDPKIKAYKVGQIARALAVFRVDRVAIYIDPILDESGYISNLLSYAVTPQYLRKNLFPLSSNLKYAGVMPPLKIPSHKPKTLKTGEVREGVIRLVGPDGTRWVDIGQKALALLRGGENVERGARVTVRVCSKKPLVVELAKAQEYWGYEVKVTQLRELLGEGDIVITSKRGRVPNTAELKELENPVFVFGNPREGVQEIAKRIGLKLENVRIWNFVPNQGTETVRLEEAIIAALSVYRFMNR